MNKHSLMFLSFLILLSFVMLSSTEVLAFEYANQELHYKFDLPEGWEEIPKVAIEEFVSALKAQTEIQLPQYETGFQQTSNQYFTHPYFLIQHVPINTVTMSQITKVFSESNWDETKTILESTDLIRNTTVGKPVADPKRKMVFMTIEAEYTGVGLVKGLLAMVPGRDGIVQIMFYDLKEHFEGELPKFDVVLNSFNFEPGYEYSWVKVKAKFWGSIFSRGMGKAIAGGILAALTALIWDLFRRARKKDKV